MSKYIIDRVTKSTKYITGYTANTRFGLRSTLNGLLANDYNGKNYHIGNDYNTPENVKLYAPCDGIIIAENRNPNADYGNDLHFYMPYYDKTVHLAHLNDVAHLLNKEIKKGTYIGLTGNTGKSTGAHLHLGIAKGKKTNRAKGTYGDGTWENPSEFIMVEDDGFIEESKPVEKPVEKPTLTDKEIAYQIVHGDNIWGDGQARKNALGDRWQGVQDEINKLLNVKPVEKPKFKPYSFTIPKGSTLKRKDGTAYSAKTTNAHKVTILEEHNGMGRFKANWLKGVSEAWVDLKKKPTPKPKPKPKPKDEYVTVGGRHTLYKASTGSGHYGAKTQQLASRKMKVIARKNGRVQVYSKGVGKFDVDSFWVKL